MADMQKVFLIELTTPDGDVKMRRPSTSRHKILAVAHYLLECTDKDSWDFTLEITRAEIAKDEVAKMIEEFDEKIHGEMAAVELSKDLQGGAMAATLKEIEASLSATTGQAVELELNGEVDEVEDEEDPTF